MDKDQERIKRYHELDEVHQRLYASPESGIALRSIFNKLGLGDDAYQFYAEVVGDTILGFFNVTDMPRLFQQKLGIGADDAQRLTSQLIEFLGPVVAREEAAAKAKQNDLKVLAEKFAEQKSTPSEQQAEPASAVEPIRTMEGDMNRIHGYGAYRELYGDEESNTQEKGRVDK